MAITQLNTAAFDYEMMLLVINKSYKGKADITLSAYNTTAAPDVKVGSVFEDNGAIFIVDTADITPTGYAGITNSTIFYLYYDESGGVFIYSNTAPSWSDVLQGWYNGNDRALFVIYKDSGGTLYQSKQLLKKQGELYTKVIPIGDWDMDTDASAAITHGWIQGNIRSVSGMIRGDLGVGSFNPIDVVDAGTSNAWGGYGGISATNIVLTRLTGGPFDSVNYGSTSYNRGFVTIQYEV